RRARARLPRRAVGQAQQQVGEGRVRPASEKVVAAAHVVIELLEELRAQPLATEFHEVAAGPPIHRVRRFVGIDGEVIWPRRMISERGQVQYREAWKADEVRIGGQRRQPELRAHVDAVVLAELVITGAHKARPEFVHQRRGQHARYVYTRERGT